MGEKPSNPHDAYFRAELSQAEAVVGLLRENLSDALAERMDWTTMERQSVSFVPAELRSRYTDILFRTRWSGRDSFVYLLVEHQSRPDRLMAFRMQEYTTAIWNRWIEDERAAGRSVKSLPLILPTVVYANARGIRWNAPTDVGDLLDVDPPDRELLGGYLPRVRFLLDDVTEAGAGKLLTRQPVVARVMLVMLLVAPGHKHLEHVLEPMAEDLRQLTELQLTRLLRYIFTVGETGANALLPVFAQVGPNTKETVVAYFEGIRAELMEELRAQPENEFWVKGRAEGRTEGQAEIVLEQLSFRFGAISDRVRQAVRLASPAELREFARRMFSATSIDEVIAG